MSKQKNKFAKRYRSLTDLGNVFNLSSVAIGKKLKEIGLRNDDGSPVESAFKKDLVVATPLKNGTAHYRWHFYRCREILIKSGLKVDSSAKIRKILKEMISIFMSDAFKMGGGAEYKILVYDFFELVKQLPIASELDDVIKVIHELKTNKSNKLYLLDVIYIHLAEMYTPNIEQIKILFDSQSRSVLMALSENIKIDDITRQRAKKEYKALLTSKK
jgi:hypothetical protein